MTDVSANLAELVQLVKKHWFEKSGLIITTILAWAIETPFLLNSQLALIYVLLTFAITALFVFIGWLVSHKTPITPKNKIGFVVSIGCADDDESERLREDFVIPLRQLVKSGKTGKAFHFIELPQHLAKRVVDPDDAQELRVKCKAHFVLYGRVRLREIQGVEHHIVELGGVVAHRPISEEVSKSFAQEFSELLPRKVSIPKENDLFSFQFTSEWADIVAKYIIGIAAALSGDLSYAEDLYSDVLDLLGKKEHDFLVYSKLKERIPIRVAELNKTRAADAHRRWVESHDPEEISRLGSCLAKINCVHLLVRLGVQELAAIHAFIANRDVDASLAYLKRSNQKNNSAWHYSMAFLLGYRGNLKSAVRHYRQGMKFPLEVDALYQVEDFLCWMQEQEPDNPRIYYLLGFFYMEVKGDAGLAITNFQSFLRLSSSSEYPKEYELAGTWIKELECSGNKMA